MTQPDSTNTAFGRYCGICKDIESNTRTYRQVLPNARGMDTAVAILRKFSDSGTWKDDLRSPQKDVDELRGELSATSFKPDLSFANA